MGNRKFKKAVIFGTISLIIGILLLVWTNRDNDPLTPLAEMREEFYVEDYELIATNETKNGLLVYSVSKVNDGVDNIYFVDMVENSFTGYNWLGGGGHVNRDIGIKGRDFLFSAQLLNEEQDITPSLFGIVLSENIERVTVFTRTGEVDATIYDGKEPGEKFYVSHFDEDVTDYQSITFTLAFNDGNTFSYTVPQEKIPRLQDGRQIYFNR